MPRRCPDASSPHLDQGRDLRCCALGKTDAGYGWLRVQLGQPGVLLLRCLGPRRAEGVAVAMFGLSLVWACSSADVRTVKPRKNADRTTEDERQAAVVLQWSL